jgi:hypothetical protein
MTLRDRLFATVAAARAVIEEPGILIVGSEVPNFLQPGAASTLVVSQDSDIGVTPPPRARGRVMSATLERRVRQYRSRMLIRAFDYRQRHHAGGVWFRLRRLLAGSSQAYVVSEHEAAQLRNEGFRVDPVGRELEPPKVIVIAGAQRVAALTSAREVPVCLGGELLSGTNLVLVPFDPA